MFLRLLLRLLQGSRGRLAIALIAVISGAAVISAMLDLNLDIERKLTQEFRTLGANLVISPKGTTAGPSTDSTNSATSSGATSDSLLSPSFMDAGPVLAEIQRRENQSVVAAAPFLYVVARAKNFSVVLAGTWLDEAQKLQPTWKLSGNSIRSRDDQSQCLIGRDVAKQLELTPGVPLELSYVGRTVQLKVAGVVDTGGAEDSQVFVNLPVAQALAGLNGQIQVVQMSVEGTPEDIGAYAAQLAEALPGYDVRPIRQVTEAEGGLLQRTHLLIVSMVALILVLTALCVLATMAALAAERRDDVGLMKALGGSISQIVGLFLAEVGVLGAFGGLVGCCAGMALARWMGYRIFGTSIAPRWEIFPLTIGLMILVALAGALPLRLLGKVKPAVIFRGE